MEIVHKHAENAALESTSHLIWKFDSKFKGLQGFETKILKLNFTTKRRFITVSYEG